MSDTKTQAAGGGIGFFGLLTILFIALKLMGKIDWSWSWVLSPLLAVPAIVVAVLACVLIVAGVIGLVDAIMQTRRLKRRLEGRR